MMSDCEMIPFATGNALCRILNELFFFCQCHKTNPNLITDQR